MEGHLNQEWSEWFGNLEIEHNYDGTTRLIGAVTDQAALHGVLAKIRDLGLNLVALNRISKIAGGDDI